MEVKLTLTPGQEVLVQRAMEQGRYRSAEEAVVDAMGRWEERERQRIDLTTDIGRAEMDLKSGCYQDYTDDTLPILADELKREAREMRASLQTR
jgi:Arc/MetJ-type ribon-helix-helix transcriptional regulator